MMQFTRFAIPTALALAIVSCTATTEEIRPTGKKLKDVNVMTLDGSSQKLFEIQKGRVLVFKFGTTWCGWCNKQLKEFNKIDKNYDDDEVVVLDIDVQEPAAKVRKHAKAAGLTFQTVLDIKGSAAGTYGVQGFPKTIVADHEGNILYESAYTPYSNLKKYIDWAVAKLEASKK